MDVRRTWHPILALVPLIVMSVIGWRVHERSTIDRFDIATVDRGEIRSCIGRDILRVPNAAIRLGLPGKPLVWLLRGNTAVPVDFEPGVSDGTYTEVKAGLAAGDRVITNDDTTIGRLL